jgi:hypothetical protein
LDGARFGRWNESAMTAFRHVPRGSISVQNESLSKAQRYRERAADCIALAEGAPEMTRAGFADMAVQWLRLAELAEKWTAEQKT